MAGKVLRTKPSARAGRPAAVDVHLAGGDLHVDETRDHEQGVEPTADVGITPDLALQGDLASDGGPRVLAVGVEGRRAVVALDDDEPPSGPQQSPGDLQGLRRPVEVLEHEADEDDVEAPRAQRAVVVREIEQVCLDQVYVVAALHPQGRSGGGQ